MNKDRRDRLSEVTSTIEEAKDQIQEIIDEDALDNLPDSLQDSERGLKMCDAINDMENLIGALDGFNTNLDGIVKKYSPQKKKKKE